MAGRRAARSPRSRPAKTSGRPGDRAGKAKKANPLQRHEFQGEKKVIYRLWSIPSFRRIDTEPTETPHATTERCAD
jgi:hypothetical protein